MVKNSKLKNNKCRTCLNGSKGLQALTKMATEEETTPKSYGELIKEITKINIMDETFNEMPQSICACCIRKLKSAHAYVQQVQEVNDKLWSMLNDENTGGSKQIDCLEEAQIDIQNCLEIKMEDEVEGGENNKEKLAQTEVDLKLEEDEAPLNLPAIVNINVNNSSNVKIDDAPPKEITPIKDVLDTSPSKSDLKMSDSEDNEEDDDDHDVFDNDFPKPNQDMSDSEDDSVASNESDWQEEDTKPLAKKDAKTKCPRTKSTKKSKKETNVDDYLPTPCDQCDRVFPNSRLLARHKRHTHVPEELKVQCPYCPNKFGRRHNMYAHMRTHHKDKPIEEHITQQRKFPRQYACEQCEGSYTNKYYLLAHIKSKHNPDDNAPKKPERVILPKKRFLCTLCGSKFDTQSNLDVHIRRHTGEKPYPCDLCERAFYRPCDVIAHRRSHTGEKPFKCTICEKAFARSNKLKIHQRTHSNERPYKCSQCEKAFKHSKDLNIHKRIHTGERPYQCGVCQSTFTQSNSLKLHQTKQQHYEVIDQAVVSC